MKDNVRSKRLFLLAVALVLAMVLATAGVSYAIINGEPDGNRHPYVAAVGGLVNGEMFLCSATAISPRILVTAAHCFETSGQPVLITFDPDGPLDPNSQISGGLWFRHPDFCFGCEPGLGFDTNDVAVVVLDKRVSLPEYAHLPTEGLVDTLAMGTEVTIVGYGVEEFNRGGGPPQRVFSAIRYFAPSSLVASNQVNSEEYIKLTQNPGQGKGAVCFGDSGGPDLLEEGGIATILAVNSYVANGNCTGVAYSNRIDTESALEFIWSFFGKARK